MDDTTNLSGLFGAEPTDPAPVTDLAHTMFGADNRTLERMITLLREPDVGQIAVNTHDIVIYNNKQGSQEVPGGFPNEASYLQFLNYLLSLTDVGLTDITRANSSEVEGSFLPSKAQMYGSIHISTSEITRGEPVLTVRKQPIEHITLDTMEQTGMLSGEMRTLLETAVRGRSNIMISGGSGAGKTTLARALSQFIDPWQRVITCEEIDELHLSDRLRNVAALTTFRKRDEDGRVIRETDLNDLVRAALRMRGDRIWVGETRGREAHALIKACNSGHDGSVTTLHADSGEQAIQQLVSYVMEGGLPEVPAREQVARAFDMVVQVSKVRMGLRAVTEISVLDPVMEGTRQRVTPLYKYVTPTGEPGNERGYFKAEFAQLPRTLAQRWARYGTNWDGGVAHHQR